MITPIPTSLSSSSSFSTVEEQRNNQKRKREEEEEMGCEEPQQTTFIPHSPSPHSQFHPTTPEKSTPYPPNLNLLQRMQIWCPCGHGVCLLKTAHTPNNYGRKFFTCPIRLGKPCGNFKWCDATIHETDLQRPLFTYPECQCLAGVCKKLMEGGKSYFICPIKQGHGSCGYRVSEDELLNNASIDEPVDNTSIVPYRQSKQISLNEYIEGDQVDTAGNDLTNDFAEGSVLLSTNKRMRITDGSENPSPVAVSEIPEGKSRGSPTEEDNSQPDGFPDIQFEYDLESIDLVAIEAEASLSSHFSTPSKTSCRQSVFQGDIISADASFGTIFFFVVFKI